MSCTACRETAPTSSQYEQKGETIQLKREGGEEFDCYVIGQGPKSVILFYDIFGINDFNKNIYRWCDFLAENGYYVIMPDFFRKDPWPVEGFPYPPEEEEKWGKFLAWMKTKNEFVQDDLEKAIFPHLASKNSDKNVAAIGFCWGGHHACLYASKGKFTGVASLHGSNLTESMAKETTCPFLLLPAEADADDTPLLEALKNHPDSFVREQSHGKRFMGMIHGFASARGDWEDDEACGKAAMEAKNMVKDFFNITSNKKGSL